MGHTVSQSVTQSVSHTRHMHILYTHTHTHTNVCIQDNDTNIFWHNRDNDTHTHTHSQCQYHICDVLHGKRYKRKERGKGRVERQGEKRRKEKKILFSSLFYSPLYPFFLSLLFLVVFLMKDITNITLTLSTFKGRQASMNPRGK